MQRWAELSYSFFPMGRGHAEWPVIQSLLVRGPLPTPRLGTHCLSARPHLPPRRLLTPAAATTAAAHSVIENGPAAGTGGYAADTAFAGGKRACSSCRAAGMSSHYAIVREDIAG